MTFQSGDPKPPGSGRQKGTPNKRTNAISRQLAALVEYEMDHVQTHLDRLKAYQPAAYLSTILRLLPYVMPRGGLLDDDDDAAPPAPPDDPQNVAV